MHLKWRKVLGILLVVAGCIGFGTVADDLHHTGELFGVGGILMAGVVLLVASLDLPMRRQAIMAPLASFLESSGFRRVPLTRNGVGHFEAAGTLNGRAVRVLIDTGAASTVMSLSLARDLGLEVQALGSRGGGAGGASLEIFQVGGADLRLGDVVPRGQGLLAMDLAHVNEALAQRGTAPIDVILGVDVFDAQAAIIDYGSASLFLRVAHA